ncbi:MAG: type IV pilus secretin PilQ [Brachymonas sp.]
MTIRTNFRFAILGAVTLSAAAVYAQSNSIQAISTLNQGGREVVKIDFKNPLAKTPDGFAIQTPARIALDFPGTGNALGKNLVDINSGAVKSANVVQVGDRTRVVLNLKQSAPYQPTLAGNSLLVALTRPTSNSVETAPVPSAPSASTFAESRNNAVLAIRDMDFRRGVDGAGRLIITLPNNQVGVDIKQQGAALALEFPRTALPEGLRRKLDVGDFGTPIQTITAYQSGDKVKVLVDAKGNWTHSAYQGDNQFVLEVRPQKVDPNKLTQGLGYTGEKLSLNFQNIEVRSLLQVIADFTNFNIITSESVNGSLTLRLKDVPWDQALDIILQAKGLGVKKSGNVLWIAPKEELAAKEKQELEAAAAVQGLEPVRTQSFQLNYTKAADVKAQLTSSSGGGGGSSSSGKMLSDRGSVIAEPRTNQLFISDIPSRLAAIQEMISKLDIPVRQVLIEARLVEAADTFGKSLGVKFGAGSPAVDLGGNARLGFGSNYTNAQGSTGGGTGTPFLSMPASGFGGSAPASMGISLFNAASSRFLALEISALEADGRGKIVSSPRVITADQTKAIIEQGTEIPYQEASSSGATSVSFKKAVLKLEVTPQITPEGSIILDLDVTKDSRGAETLSGPAIDTKHVLTQVLVDNGGTVVIGGIFTMEERNNEEKVPLLGDLPGVGNLFKNRRKTVDKQELLVFITPKIVSEKSFGSR